jgi:predicted dehydrogenase
MSRKIGVGIIGASPDRSWAAMAHIPALKLLPDFEIVAVSTTRRESADAAGEVFGVPNAFDNYDDLVKHPAVDVVVVAVRVSYHFELVSAALHAGKSVYCEWPLGNGLVEAQQLAALARDQGVLAVIGLQARAAPVVNYVRDLIKNGYVGEILSTTLIGSGESWGPVIDQANAYTADIGSGATMLSIPLAHTVDAVCYCLGEVREASAVTANRRKTFIVAETGTVKPMSTHDQVLVGCLLDNNIPLSIHYRGGSSRGTNLLWEINGTAGDLQLTAASGFGQIHKMSLRGGRDSDTALQSMPVPARYHWAPAVATGPVLNVAQAYARFARDFLDGTHSSPTFDDAVTRHRMVRAIEIAASSGQRQNLSHP